MDRTRPANDPSGSSQGRAWRVALLAALLVIAVAVAVAWSLLASSDTTVRFETVTAVPAPVPPVPVAATELAWSDRIDWREAILPAGTGLVASDHTSLRAFDGLTGEPRWSHVLTNAAITSAVASDDGTLVAVGVTRDASTGPRPPVTIQLFDGNTGQIKGQFQGQRGDRLVGATDELAIVLRPPPNSSLLALDPTGDLAWSITTMDSCTPLDADVVADVVVVVAWCGDTRRTMLHGLSAATGESLWSRQVEHDVEGVTITAVPGGEAVSVSNPAQPQRTEVYRASDGKVLAVVESPALPSVIAVGGEQALLVVPQPSQDEEFHGFHYVWQDLDNGQRTPVDLGSGCRTPDETWTATITRRNWIVSAVCPRYQRPGAAVVTIKPGDSPSQVVSLDWLPHHLIQVPGAILAVAGASTSALA